MIKSIVGSAATMPCAMVYGVRFGEKHPVFLLKRVLFALFAKLASTFISVVFSTIYPFRDGKYYIVKQCVRITPPYL